MVNYVLEMVNVFVANVNVIILGQKMPVIAKKIPTNVEIRIRLIWFAVGMGLVNVVNVYVMMIQMDNMQVSYYFFYRVSQVKLDETKRSFQTENTPWRSETWHVHVP